MKGGTVEVTEGSSSVVDQGDAVPGSSNPICPATLAQGSDRDMTASSIIDGDACRLRIDTAHRADAVTLRLRGEADMASSEVLARCLSSLPVDSAIGLRLDLTALRFADAATVAELGTFAASARSHGHPISTCGASRLVCRVADLLGLANALGLSTDRPNISGLESRSGR